MVIVIWIFSVTVVRYPLGQLAYEETSLFGLTWWSESIISLLGLDLS